MRAILLITSLPLGIIALISVFGILISIANGSENLMKESFAALIVSAGAIFLIIRIDQKSNNNKSTSTNTKELHQKKSLPPAEMKNPATLQPTGLNHENLDRAPKQSTVTRKNIRVAGVSHSNTSGPSRQECISKTSKTDAVWLERDQNNPHDKNAIRIMTRHGQIGFIPIEHSASLEGTNINNIKASFISKGRAQNGLLGCTIEISIKEDSIPSSKTQINSEAEPFPTALQAKNSFKKESAIAAAQDGLLNRNQILAVIDNAHLLELSAEDLSIFEHALRNTPFPGSKPTARINPPRHGHERTAGEILNEEDYMTPIDRIEHDKKAQHTLDI